LRELSPLSLIHHLQIVPFTKKSAIRRELPTPNWKRRFNLFFELHSRQNASKSSDSSDCPPALMSDLW
ncbi:hypothetical protein LINPERHAP2_LOCUS38611, partial [Linum perenne]